MKIIKLHFYLLVCCGAAESFTEKSVDLGQNVTLECEVDVKNVYWFLMKPSEPPVFILRSFSSRSLRSEFNNTPFNKTFSLRYNSSLFIHNISTNELGVYYCIQTGSPPDISRGIRLYIQNHSAGKLDALSFPENRTCDEPNQTADESKHDKLWRNLFIVLAVFNCLVVVVVVVVVITRFTVRRCRRSPKTRACRKPPDPRLRPQHDNSSPVYAEVQDMTTNGTYTLLQLPNP